MFRKADLIFVALAVLVVVGVTLLPSPKDQNPAVPKNAAHQGMAVEKDCLRCHVVGGVQPLSVRHPKRQDCFRCHRTNKDS